MSTLNKIENKRWQAAGRDYQRITNSVNAGLRST
jgi:hypothetical protein